MADGTSLARRIRSAMAGITPLRRLWLWAIELIHPQPQRVLRPHRLLYRLRGLPTVYFLHIGKTGGSAVRHAIGDDLVTDRCRIAFLTHRRHLRDVPPGGRVVFFLRDPIARFLSAFYARQRKDWPRYSSDWKPAERLAFETFDTANDLAEALSSDDESLRGIATDAMQGIPHIRSSFWDWFETEEYFLSREPDLLHIGFQEHLAADFEALKSKLGLDLGAALPTDSVSAHRSPDGVDKSLSETARRNLESWYARDFEFMQRCRAMADDINARDLGERSKARPSGWVGRPR